MEGVPGNSKPMPAAGLVALAFHIPAATLWAFPGGDLDKGLAELETPAKAMIDDLLWWTAVEVTYN